MPGIQSVGGKTLFVDWAKDVRKDAHIREDFEEGPFEIQPAPLSHKRCGSDKVYWIRGKNNELYGIPQVLLEVVEPPV